ncbi:MAG: hypothetical protein ACETWM_17435 [Candidatus Lokiarchaeia archaeon]
MLSEFLTTKKILCGLGMMLVGILVGAIQDYFEEMPECNQSYSPVHSGSVRQSYQSYEEIEQKNELIEKINRKIDETIKIIDEILSK